MVNMNLKFFRWAPQRAASNLVFLHGMGGTGAIWRAITAKLEDEYVCIAPDQRGHGDSRPVPAVEQDRFHAQDYASDVSQLLEEQKIDRYTLIGHSMGVRTAMALALIEPEKVNGLIAVDIGITTAWGGGIGLPLADFIEKLPETFPTKALLREHLFAHCPDPGIAQYLSAVSKKISDAPETWAFPFDHLALVKTIHQANEAPLDEWLMKILESGVRVLFLRGANSLVWLKEDYEKQKALFQHPLLSFEEWENAGHGLPFEQREKFIEKIRLFAGNS